MSGSLSCGGTKKGPNPGQSAALCSLTDRLAQASRSAGSAGVGRRSNSPQARQGLSLIGLARDFTRRREDMVILMVTSSMVNAERN